jgi:hypothetical protein
MASVTEPQWPDLARAITSGELKVTDRMKTYVTARASGMDHALAAEAIEAKGILGFKMRKRLAEGYSELLRIKAGATIPRETQEAPV